MKEQQHIVSEFYLKGFADPETGLVQWYDRRASRWKALPPRAIIKAGDYYTVRRGGKKDNTVDEVWKLFEGAAAPIVRDKILQSKPIDQRGDRPILAFYVASIWSRTPRSLRWSARIGNSLLRGVLAQLADPGEFRRTKERYERDSGTRLGDDIDHRAFADLLKERPRLPKGQVLKPIVTQLASLAGRVTSMCWSLIYAPEDQGFITCDNPVIPFGVDRHSGAMRYGLAHRRPRLVFPLSSCVCLLATGTGGTNQRRRASSDEVKAINRVMLLGTDRFVVSRTRDFPGAEHLAQPTWADIGETG